MHYMEFPHILGRAFDLLCFFVHAPCNGAVNRKNKETPSVLFRVDFHVSTNVRYGSKADTIEIREFHSERSNPSPKPIAERTV
jgi:hypothetical protein